MRAIDRYLIRGGHYGQRSCEPHKQAEHMAASTNAASVQKSLANTEPSTHGTSRHSAACPLLEQERTCRGGEGDVNDAVDGAHSAASIVPRVVALKRTTMRGAVHGRG
jgi:hypothetical protein